MRLIVPTIAAMLALGGAAHAMPNAPTPDAPATIDMTPVAMGCGIGRTRDAMGRCHHPFNRFHQHRRFRAYERSHCKPLHTPNGPVGFCKV